MLLGLLASCSVFSACLALTLYRTYFLHKTELRRQIRSQFGYTQAAGSWITRLTQRFDRSSTAAKVAEELAQMHVPVQPSEYIAFQLLAIVVLTCLFCTLLGLSIWPALLMAIISVQLFKRIMVRTRKNKNMQLMNKQLPEVCRLMANSLRAGLTITQAFELIARELASPAGKEFFNMHREMELGAEFDNVLMRFQQRIDSRDIVLFAGVVINQRKIGGNLVQVLEHMAKTLQERLLMQEAIKTMTAESKYISYILPIVPVVLLVMMNSLIEGFLQPLYTVPGLLLLASFIAVQAVAFVTVSKISGFKV